MGNFCEFYMEVRCKRGTETTQYERLTADMRTILIIILLIGFIACRQTSDVGNQLNVLDNKTIKTPNGNISDTASVRKALKHHLELTKEFNDTISSEVDSNYYHLILYTAFREGTAIKFIKKNGVHFMYVKTLRHDSAVKLNYSTKIDREEWDQLENMVDDFNFWTEQQFKYREVLDGYVFYLEGNRFSDNRKLHRIIGRGSPQYDKIGALCNYILDYQESLVYKYKQINK